MSQADDHVEEEVAALLCAARAVRPYAVREKTFQGIITDTKRYIDKYERALYEIEHRVVSLQMAPGPAQFSGHLMSLPNPAKVDAWSRDPATIESTSRVVSMCTNCNGCGTVKCGRCSGSAQVRCGNCWGSGRISDKAGKRACGVCGGAGKVLCGACNSGRVPCQPCGVTGRVWAWLHVSQTVRQQVRVHPIGAAAGVHKGILNPEDFDADSWINILDSDTGVDPLANASVPSELAPELDAAADRLLSIRIQSFSSLVHRFSYQVCRATGIIEVAGAPPATSKSSTWRPLRIRLAIAAATGGLVAAIAFQVMGAYANRHSWYLRYGHQDWIMLTGFVAAVALAVAAAGLSLPRRLWSTARVWAPLAMTGLAAIGIGVIWRVPHPTASVALAALKANDRDRAATEAIALSELGIDQPGAAVVLDGLHTDRLREARTYADILAIVREPWSRDEVRAIAMSSLHDAAVKKASDLYAAKDAAGLTSLGMDLGDSDPAVRATIAADVAILEADKCAAQRDCICVKLQIKAAGDELGTDAKRVRDAALPGMPHPLSSTLWRPRRSRRATRINGWRCCTRR
jgi:hypothetical protein